MAGLRVGRQRAMPLLGLVAAMAISCWVLGPRPVAAQDYYFIRGDVNVDSDLDLSDPIAILLHLFVDGYEAGCLDAADADDDGTLTILDVTLLLEHLFELGEAPADPAIVCGPDPTDDPLDCETFLICPLPPIASFTSDPTSGEAPLQVFFDATESTDEDGAVLAYSWDFGDGGEGAGPTIEHTFTSEGDFTVTLTVADDDGATSLATEVISVAGFLPYIVSSTSPTGGDDGVAVTRETVIDFSGPILVSSLLEEDVVVALRDDEVLSIELHTSPLSSDPDATDYTDKLTIFYPSDLPASSLITVLIEGDELVDDLDRALDGDADGATGGAYALEFATLSLTPVVDTSVSGRVFATQYDLGRDDEIINIPLEGVTVSIDGTAISVVTDDLGSFRLDDVPAGRFFVHVDGTTMSAVTIGGEEVLLEYPAGPYFPNVGKTWTSTVGEESLLDPVYLPLIDEDALVALVEGEETEICFDLGDGDEICIVIPADALYADDGTVGGMVGIGEVDPTRLPGVPPLGLEFSRVFTVQTDGPTNFDQPVAVCFPNDPDPATGEPLEPGETSALWSFNHDSGQWEVVATVTVSDDGTLLCSDPGQGILAPGWHATGQTVCAEGGPITEEPEGKEQPEPPPEPEDPPPVIDDFDAHATCSIGEKVYLHSGEETFERTDLVIPGRGELDFVLTRRYRSQWNHDGPMGYGWDFNYNEALYPRDNGDVVRCNGRGRVSRWNKNDDDGFDQPTGYFSDMSRNRDGDYEIINRDGFRRIYHQNGRLQAYQDRNGNQMVFVYDNRGNIDFIVDSYGREIDFTYAERAGRARLVSVRDFIGREVIYSYDANGDLTEVRTPRVLFTETDNDFPNGRTERYTYSSGFDEEALNHNILSITFPEEAAVDGPEAISWEYGEDPDDPLTFDRVLAENLGGGNVNSSGVPAGGTITFEYEMLNGDEPLGDLELPRGRVLVTERNGNQFEYFVNELKHHIITRRLTRGLREDEPEYYETLSFYDADGQLVRQEYPEGNSLECVYATDSPRRGQRNLLERRLIADADRGGGEDLVTTYTYEPLYNQVASSTDPRGNAEEFVPPIGDASADRYTTHRTFDYQEGTPAQILDLAAELGVDLDPDGDGPLTALGIAEALSLGEDVNGDDRTDQRSGNVVRLESPAVTLREDSSEAERLDSTTQVMLVEVVWNDHGQKLSITDEEGNVHAREYYPENDPDGDGNVMFSMFIPLSPDDPSGYLRSTTIDARDSDRRTASVEPAALEILYTYDAVGNRTSERNPRGVVSSITYNQLNEPIVITRASDVDHAVEEGQLLSETKAFAYQTRLYYDNNGRVVRQEVENRDETTPGVGEYVEHDLTYDILNNIVEQRVEVGSGTIVTREFLYDENELPMSRVQSEGNQNWITYDERNLPLTITQGFGSEEESTITIHYDLNGNRREIVDAADNDDDPGNESTVYAYDGFDRPIAVTDALGNVIESEFDPASNRIRRVAYGHPADAPGDPNELLSDVSYFHDELHRVYQIDSSLFLSEGFVVEREADLQDANDDGVVTEYVEYDALSRMTFVTEDDGETTAWSYDGASRNTEVSDALGNTLVRTFDNNSNVVRVTSYEQATDEIVAEEVFETIYVWDQLDRLVRATDNIGQTARFGYDSRDNLILSEDPEGSAMKDPLELFPKGINGSGNRIRVVFDGLDRTIEEITELRVGGTGDGDLDTASTSNPDGLIIERFEWDGNNRLTARADDNGNETTFEYDALNRVISMELADGATYLYTFDADDNLLTQTDPNGTVATSTYDALDREVTRTVKPAEGVVGTTDCAYGYDGLSRLTSTRDSIGDDSEETELVYDSMSRLLEERLNGAPVSNVWSGDSKRLQCTYPGGRVIDFEYDEVDRVSAIVDDLTTVAGFNWVGPGIRELSRLYGNGTQVTMLDDDGAEDIGWDDAQRLVRLRHLDFKGTPLVDREYTYNRANVLTSEIRHDDGDLTDVFTYDSAYRLTSTDYDQDGTDGSEPRDLLAESFDYDGVGNRVLATHVFKKETIETEFTVNSVNEYSSVAGDDRVHDDNGNLVETVDREYAYDYRNRLMEARNARGDVIAEYRYFVDGRRSRKILYDPDSGTVTDEILYFYDDLSVCEERDAGSDDTLATYVWDPSRVDCLLQLDRSTDSEELVYYAHEDWRGSVVALSDDSGAAVQRVRYDTFGKPSVDGAVDNPYLFQGRRFDSETGLYYFRNRYYDPDTGRFLQRDPVWDGANVGNQYSFARNSPVSYGDPLGLATCDLAALEKARSEANEERKLAHAERDRLQKLADEAEINANAAAEQVQIALGLLQGVKLWDLLKKMGRAVTPLSSEIDFLRGEEMGANGGIVLTQRGGQMVLVRMQSKIAMKEVLWITGGGAAAAIVGQWIGQILTYANDKSVMRAIFEERLQTSRVSTDLLKLLTNNLRDAKAAYDEVDARVKALDAQLTECRAKNQRHLLEEARRKENQKVADRFEAEREAERQAAAAKQAKLQKMREDGRKRTARRNARGQSTGVSRSN